MISGFHVDARQLGQDGVGEHGDGVVADHAVVVLPPEVPDGQVAVGLMVQHHVPHKLRGDVGRDEGVEGVGGPEGIPETEGAVIHLSLGHLLDFEVGVHISSIHVAHRVGLHQHVIQTGIEDGLLLVGAFDVDTAEFFLPGIVGGLHIVVKTPTFCLGLHVLSCTFVIHRRNGHFDQQFVAVFRIKVQGSTEGATVHHIAVADIEPAIHQDMTGNWFGELGAEIHFSQFSPSANNAIAFDSVVIDETNLSLDDIIITAT